MPKLVQRRDWSVSTRRDWWRLHRVKTAWGLMVLQGWRLHGIQSLACRLVVVMTTSTCCYDRVLSLRNAGQTLMTSSTSLTRDTYPSTTGSDEGIEMADFSPHEVWVLSIIILCRSTLQLISDKCVQHLTLLSVSANSSKLHIFICYK